MRTAGPMSMVRLVVLCAGPVVHPSHSGLDGPVGEPQSCAGAPLGPARTNPLPCTLVFGGHRPDGVVSLRCLLERADDESFCNGLSFRLLCEVQGGAVSEKPGGGSN